MAVNKYTVTYGLNPPQEQSTHEMHILAITKILVPPDAGYFLTCGRDGTVIKHCYDDITDSYQKRIRMQVHSDWVSDIIEVSRNRYVVVSNDFSLSLLTLHAENDAWESKIIGYHEDYVKCATLLPSRGAEDYEGHEGVVRFATSGLDKKVKVWSLSGCEASLLHTFDNAQPDETGSLYAMAAVQNHAFDVVVGDNNGNLNMYSTSGEYSQLTIPRAHNTNVKAVKPVDGGRRLLTASSDGMIKLWDATCIEQKEAAMLHSWKWPSSIWCIEAHSSNEFFIGDSRGQITKLTVQDDDRSAVQLCSVFKSTDKDHHGVLAMNLQGRKLWFSLSSNSDLNLVDLRDATFKSIRGGFALLKCSLLTDRRHVITQNTMGHLQRWDIISCELLDYFDDCDSSFDEMVHKYNTKEVLPHWCSVSIKTGKLFVKFSPRFVDTEVYGSALDDYNIINKVELNIDQRYNLGKIVVNSILDEFIRYELDKDKEFRKELVAKKVSNPGTPPMLAHNPAYSVDNIALDGTKPISREKRRLSLFTKFSSSSSSAVNSNPGHLTPNSLPSTPTLVEHHAGPAEEHPLLPPPAEAPSTAPLPALAYSTSGHQTPPPLEARSASSGSLLTRKLRIFSAANATAGSVSDALPNTVHTDEETSLAHDNNDSSAPGTPKDVPDNFKWKFTSKNFSGSGVHHTGNGKSKPAEEVPATHEDKKHKKEEFMSDFIDEIREEYSRQISTNSSSFKLLGRRAPESAVTRDNNSPIIQIKSGCLLLVNCWREGSCGETVSFATYLPAPRYAAQGDDKQQQQQQQQQPEDLDNRLQIFSSLEKNLPYWIAKALFKDDSGKVIKDYPKLNFVLTPWEDPRSAETRAVDSPQQAHHSHHHLGFHRTKTNDGILPPLPHIDDSKTKLNAPSMIKVKKILHYVVDRFESRIPEMKSRVDVADWLELLCKGQVLDNDMTLGTVRTLYWKSSGDIILEYRRKQSDAN